MSLFRFRFVSAGSLSGVLEIRRVPLYRTLEKLVELGYVMKRYDKGYRSDRKPAVHCLSKEGVTIVRKLVRVEERIVNQHKSASAEFIEHGLITAGCRYSPLLAC